MKKEAFSIQDAKQDDSDRDVRVAVQKIVDQQALVTANGAAADEVIPGNVAIPTERTWYGIKCKGKNHKNEDTQGGRYKYDFDDGSLPYTPPNTGSRGQGYVWYDRPAAYLSVDRTDKEDEAVKAILLYKTDKEIVPERIEVDGATYYCASVKTPIGMVKDAMVDSKNNYKKNLDELKKQNYFLYYTTNAGVSPGQPITELSVDDEIFHSGYATNLCADKQDVSKTSAGGKKTKVDVARPYGEPGQAAYVHAAYVRAERMYFNRIYVANGPKRNDALAELLGQGCTEFLNMNLNDATTLTEEEMKENEKEEDEEDKKEGGDFVYFGYRGYSLDDEKIKEATTQEAKEAEKQSQLEEAVYDVVCTVGEDYHPEGIVTDLNQLYYSPVSKTDKDGNTSGTDLNAGTNGPPIYMYFSTPWGASQYNASIGNNTRKDISTMPQDIFSAPIARFCFTRYDRVPYGGDIPASSTVNESERNYNWEYILCSDNKIPVDLNDGAIVLDSEGHTQNNKIMMFAQRSDGSVKPAAEITGGYTSSTVNVGEMWWNK